MYLSAMQYPDFRTICNLRLEHAREIQKIFVEVVRVCAKLERVGLGHIAFDGTKLKANASIKQTRDEKGLQEEITRIEAEVKKMMERSRQIDQAEDSLYEERNGSEMPKELINRQSKISVTFWTA